MRFFDAYVYGHPFHVWARNAAEATVVALIHKAILLKVI